MAVRFSSDDGFDFAVRCLLNGVPYGMADPGEVLAATGDLDPGDPDAWFDALTALGDAVEASADASAAGGHRVSAAGAYLRAANYRYAGFWYVLGTRDPGRWESAWQAHRRCLDAALDHRSDVERLDALWADTTLPILFFRAPVEATAPLVVVQGGLGAPLSDALMTGVLDAVARGWHAVAFEGPGQGRVRMVDGVGPVDDWAPVMGAVLDAVLGGADRGIDPDRIAVIGVADGAVLALQAAAREPRIRALVCDPGVVRELDGVLDQLPDDIADAWDDEGDATNAFEQVVRDAGAADRSTAFAVAKVLEEWPNHTLGEVLARLAGWDVTPLLDAVRVPVLVTDPEEATSYPGQSAELADALGEGATLMTFTSEEGAGLDCEIGAPLVRAQRIGDWLDDVFNDLGTGSAG